MAIEVGLAFCRVHDVAPLGVVPVRAARQVDAHDGHAVLQGRDELDQSED